MEGILGLIAVGLAAYIERGGRSSFGAIKGYPSEHNERALKSIELAQEFMEKANGADNCPKFYSMASIALRYADTAVVHARETGSKESSDMAMSIRNDIYNTILDSGCISNRRR